MQRSHNVNKRKTIVIIGIGQFFPKKPFFAYFFIFVFALFEFSIDTIFFSYAISISLYISFSLFDNIIVSLLFSLVSEQLILTMLDIISKIRYRYFLIWWSYIFSTVKYAGFKAFIFFRSTPKWLKKRVLILSRSLSFERTFEKIILF